MSDEPRPGRLFIIRTSDRGSFKRCRRRWDFSSALRMNRGSRDRPGYFWIGSAGHFALEDWYGYNYYGGLHNALHAYVEAQQKYSKHIGISLPSDWRESVELLEGILDNYEIWLENREDYPTVWIDGEPQVEITGHIPLPIEPPPGYDAVMYQFTLDRLVEIDDEWWILDWKFYKQFDQGDLAFNPQMSAYIWAASAIYERPIAGAILHEFRKEVPKAPRILANGTISTATNQMTTHGKYRRALKHLYGSVDDAPASNIKTLNQLASREAADRDDFIRRRRTRRTPAQLETEGSKILAEVQEMCNPDLPIYPNFTKDCSWDCGLQDVCLMMDRQEGWQEHLELLTIQRTEEDISWRQFLPKVA